MSILKALCLIIILLPSTLPAAEFDFHQQQGEKTGATLLVIGGVDGDEPGGFHAAATLTTHYRIGKGQLWVVPNLNFSDILKRQRGDMNLKFVTIKKSDPDYHNVEAIKKIITRPEVGLILNLHDGSGFYHPQRLNNRRGPERWGQSCVIDQEVLTGVPYGNLRRLAETTIQRINASTSDREHHFQLKVTHTAAAKDAIPAKKSLSFFAVRHKKPAIAVEASKEHPVHLRVYYHLVAIESFMQQLGISYQRDFSLTPTGVQQIIKNDALITLAEGRIQLELNNMRPAIGNFPMPKHQPIDHSAKNPLVTLLPAEQRYRIHYGNNRLAFLAPRYVELDHGIDTVTMEIDGRKLEVPFGSIIPVSQYFNVAAQKEYQVNVVGFPKPPNRADDAHTLITLPQLETGYSIDKAGRLYRVEVYRDERFSGMILVDFRPQSRGKEPLIAHAAENKNLQGEQPN
ncbi:MAG: hypothetical protein JXQ81_04145 [Desulfuromonadales bacterium]|nr:hypothetical protein [Desulfuromonadales bacterium]MBN2791681.1 hypothetical protein [Desulfuromonadales bacterium]